MGLSALNKERVAPILLGIIAMLIGTFVLGVILLKLKSVLIPLAVALLLSIIFQPIVRFLRMRRVPTVLSLAVVALAILLALALPGYLVYASAVSLTRSFDSYVPRIEALIDDAEGLASRLAGQLGIDLAEVDLSQIIDISAVTSIASGALGEVVTILANVLLVVLFMMFLLASGNQLNAKIKIAYAPETAARILGVIGRISDQVRRYLIAKALVSAGTGLLVFLVLLVLGVDFPVFWGFLAFVLNFIPTVGDLVATLLPTLLALLQFDTLVVPVLCFVLLWVVQALMGNVLQPRLMAFTLNLSPVVVLLSLIFWAWFWGIPGMILAVPLTATVKIIFENIDGLRPLAVLMGSAPAAKPISANSASD